MTNTNIFLGSGASVTFVPEVDIYLKPAAFTSVSLSTGATTSDSKVVTYGSNTNVVVGMAITGTNIPNGAVVVTVDSATQATLDKAATGTGSSITFTATNIKTLNLDTDFTSRFDLVDDLYVGCVLEFYDNGTHTTSHRVTSNDSTTLTFHPGIHPSSVVLDTSNDYFHLKGYGAPCPANSGSSNLKHLNADYWMGILESLTFPSLEVEFKQQNLFVGGSRNFTYQYKGIETAGNASVNVVANHGAWLYYFFGKCSAISATLVDPDLVLAGGATTNTDATVTVTSTAGLKTGMAVSGTNIPAGATVASVTNATTFELSSAATGTGSSITITATITDFVGANTEGYYLNSSSVTDTGPLFYRTLVKGSGTTEQFAFNPPLLRGQDASADVHKLTEPSGTTTISNPITYTFSEQDGDDLPSFAMEQVFSKLPSANTYSTNTADADEDTNFVLIATGNRINTLTMTANENEELKMTLDTMPRKLHNLTKGEKYAARRSVTDETSFKNYSDNDKFLEPFFFSGGSISLFGQNFLKITNFTLTMNNTLTDKRFIGIGNKSVKDAIPAQRTYELSFTALVTDDKLFNELKNQDENQLANSGALIDLIFDKENGEQIRLKFDNYMLTTNNWPIPEDKGPVMVEATIIPRTLNSCTVKTHWILQG
tara:strand:+ start:445 stop:2415 length:1971 start_codon:yes stop_codon:yes gene_type:complete